MFQCGTFLGLFLYFFNLFHLIEFSWIIQIITASHSNNKKMNGKMIFMLFSIMWGRVQEQTTNFEHLVHETWPWTCGQVVFKFYKKANEVRKSWNLLRYQDIICGGCDKKIEEVSRKFVMNDAYHLVGLFTKSWNFFGDFSVCKHRTWQLARNLLDFLSQSPHMISWHLDKFHDFRTLFVFYRI
jgi:hypothetical protein